MKLLNVAAAALASALMLTPAHAGGVNVGTLACQVDPAVGLLVASNARVTCDYHPVNGADQVYVGEISHLGIDVGYTSGSAILWAVVAPGSLKHGALEGTYLGASGSASLGAGVGVNVLVGGLNGSITLQPVSVQGQVGLNLTLAGTSLTLTHAK